ncbi:MAG: DUF3575 domain-containing protein [Saprospiraceae bacterium]
MRKLALLVVLFCITVTVHAQENIVKLGLGSALNGQINLEYERALTEKTSVLAEVSFKIPNKLPDNFFSQLEGDGTVNNIQFDEGKLGGFLFAAEYRFYTKGNAPKGFYISPYLKLNNNKFDLTGSYNNNTTGATNIASEASLGLFSASIGGNIGYQWLIADKVSINWNILGLGLGINRVSGEFTAADNGVFDDFAQDVTEFLDAIPILPNIAIESSNAEQTIKASDSFLFPAARVSLSVGYAF